MAGVVDAVVEEEVVVVVEVVAVAVVAVVVLPMVMRVVGEMAGVLRVREPGRTRIKLVGGITTVNKATIRRWPGQVGQAEVMPGCGRCHVYW